MHVSDAQLVATWQQTGHRGALETLVGRHLPTVRKMVFSLVLDDDAADELTQEVFLRAIRALGSFRGESEFSTWLYRIAVNCARSGLSQRRRIPRESLAAANVRVRDASAHEEAVTQELDSAIQEALSKLKPHLRTTVALICLDGLDASEAAEIEGCRVATIRWRLHEARRQLRKSLKKYLSQ